MTIVLTKSSDILIDINNIPSECRYEICVCDYVNMYITELYKEYTDFIYNSGCVNPEAMLHLCLEQVRKDIFYKDDLRTKINKCDPNNQDAGDELIANAIKDAYEYIIFNGDLSEELH